MEREIELIRPNTIEEMASSLLDIDCVLTIGYGVLLPAHILEIPTYGFLNLHFSLLPRWRGAAPVQRAIEAGDSLTGVTVFQLDEGMDTGPFYTMHRFALDLDITSDELLAELADLGVIASLEALQMVEDGKRPTAQSSEGVSRAKKLSREEGRINWNFSAELVSSKIRAFTSSPGAWSTFRELPIKIAAPKVSEVMLNPGEIALINKEVFIGTTTTALQIGSITSAGKAPTPAHSWANGMRLLPGEKCE
jgi:methionyl-tRNA formyltransferase